MQILRKFIISCHLESRGQAGCGVGKAGHLVAPSRTLALLPFCQPQSDLYWEKGGIASLSEEEERAPLPGMMSQHREAFL